MDVFRTHTRMVNVYRSHIHGFLNIDDVEIPSVVWEELKKGRLSPEAHIQFNPSYEMAGGVKEVAEHGILHPKATDILAADRLHTDEMQTIRLGTAVRDSVLTSGTGSGRSPTYIGSIFHHLLTTIPTKILTTRK